MYARVTHLQILPEKMEEFRRAMETIRPEVRKQAGFRGLVVLREGTTNAPEATSIAMWESLEHLRASEKNLFLYQALSRLLVLCKGFPTIREHEVLACELAPPETPPTQKKGSLDDTV